MLPWARPSSLANGLALDWQFREGQGDATYDSQNGVYATLANRPLWTAPPGSSRGWSLRCNGSNQYIWTPYTSAPSRLHPPPGYGFTVECVVTFNAGPSSAIALNKEGAYRLFAGDVSTTKLAARFATSVVGWGSGLTGSTTLTTGKQYHGLLTWNGSICDLYLNGRLEATRSQTGTVVTNTNNLVVMSYEGTGSFVNGWLHRVRIWHRGLTAGEVYQAYLESLDSVPRPIQSRVAVALVERDVTCLLEILGRASHSPRLPVEWDGRRTVEQIISILLDWSYRLNLQHDVPLEWLGRVNTVRAVTLPVEWLALAQQAVTLLVESGGLADGEIQELLTILSRDGVTADLLERMWVISPSYEAEFHDQMRVISADAEFPESMRVHDPGPRRERGRPVQRPVGRVSDP